MDPPCSSGSSSSSSSVPSGSSVPGTSTSGNNTSSITSAIKEYMKIGGKNGQEEEEEEEEGEEEQEEEQEEQEEEEVDDDEPPDAVPTASGSGSVPAGGSSSVAVASGSSLDSPVPCKRQVIMSYSIEDYVHPSSQSSHDLRQSFTWAGILTQPEFVAAPVEAFKHAPMSKCWGHIIVGMKVEVKNKDSETNYPGVFPESFWVASVLRIVGYYALLRYEGSGQDGSKDFWMHICSDRIHPVGWCATRGKPLIPPKTIQSKQSDWKDFLVKRLTGARTTPINFYAKIWETVGSYFEKGMKLEVVDKMRICQVRVATIQEITGRRLFVQYDDVDHDDKGFWCHEESPLIHPVGWAKRVGHQIVASPDYYARCASEQFLDTDCTADMFPDYHQPPGSFSVGMKIEAVDPLNLATVCVATVMKVLRFGYIMIRIDGYETDESGSDWFCYHGSSPLIFPPGFCEKNKISLKPPAGWENRFTWYNYLKDTKSQAAPVNLFISRDEVKHPFKVGMKLEATDQMDPRLVCVSTVSRVVGRLLKIHFDGWEDDYDQWMDCENVDIYPVGWAELVGHKLEGAKPAIPQKKDKKKTVGRKGKKRSSNGSAAAGGAAATSALSPANRGASSGGSSGGAKPRGNKTTAVSPVSAASSSSPAASLTPPPPVLEPQTEAAAPPASSSSPLQLKVIPRLVDSAGQASSSQRGRDANLDPASWTPEEVAQFLEINECASLVEPFMEQGVDGNRFLSLNKADVMKLVNNKIGPCLKVENLLSLLKARMNPAQARFLATINRKST